jgi:hypothetical protein
MRKSQRGLGLIILMAITLMSSLLLTACGGKLASAENAVAQSEAQGVIETQARRDRTPPITPVATRVASTPTPLATADAITALTTWNQQTLGINPTISNAKGINRDVLAEYNIITGQYGMITANIDASRAAYAGKIQNGGATVLLLGGGSTAANEDLSLQIKKASLGYTQLPANSFPASSDAALAQLKQAFPGVSSYSFEQTKRGGQNSYIFYATSTETLSGRPPVKVATGVSVGVVKIGDKAWTYAFVGTGEFAPTAK